LLFALLAGCGHGASSTAQPTVSQAKVASASTPAMLDAQFSEGRMTRAITDLIASAQLPAGEAFKIVELGRDAHSSHHIVSLRDREPLHRHETHDLLVFVIEGHGHMRIGDQQRAIGERSVVYVPRGAPHAMSNTSTRPLVGYAVFTPAFDGQDRILVESEASLRGEGAVPPIEAPPRSEGAVRLPQQPSP
jgi:mannose-6-phosphate isomerase-like protein (cupin superfamily)